MTVELSTRSASVKTAYEANANTNAFTDAEKTKLAGIEAAADVTDAANVQAAGALMDSEVDNLEAVKVFDPTDYAAASHSHAISDVTGLQTALDGKTATGHSHAISDVTGLQTALDGKSATGHTHVISDTTGLQDALDDKADLVGGVIPTNQIPAIAITEYLGEVANQSAMLALVGQKGDWCVRTDTGTVFVITGVDPSDVGDWTQLEYPGAPVTSVNSQTGAVTLGAADVGAATAAQGDLADSALQPTLFDAAGDLLVGTGADTGGRLAMGTALQQIRVNAGGTALEYFTPSASGDFKADGSVDMTGTFGTDVGTFRSDVANGASAVGFEFNTANAFSTAGAKIASFKNNATEKAYVDKDGGVYSANSGGTGFYMLRSGFDVAFRLLANTTNWNSGHIVGWASSTNAVGTNDTGFKRAAAAVVGVTNGSTGGGALEFQEQTAPAAGATNHVRIYAEDNGSGKTRLMAIFPTGAAQQIAIEP